MRASHPGGVQICVGQSVASEVLRGSWLSYGTAPQGFFDLEAAINFACNRYPDMQVIGLRVRGQQVVD